MTRELLLAVDLGTTGTRALAVGADGRVLARAHRTLETRFPAPGRVEQDPEALWEHSLEVLREALAASGRRAGEVAAIGVASQRSTAVAWDAGTGAALCPALSWQDRRTVDRVAELRARGIPISTLPSATKFEWWLAHEPAVARALSAGRLRLGTPDAWLTHRLTGGEVFATDPGHASCTALYDLAAGSWSALALGFFGIPEEVLPRVAPSSAVLGETPAALLGAAIPVASRAGDQQAAAFAQGLASPGDAKLTLGTAAMLDVHAGSAPAPATPEQLRAGCYPLALWRLDDGSEAFCVEGTVVTAGAVMEWLATLGLLPEPAALDAVAGSVPDAGGAAFVPALQGLGTPILDDAARGLLGGLTRGTSAAHVVRAALEGVAQRCADVCEALAPGGAAPAGGAPLRVDGGLSRSDLLLRTLADLCGRTLWRAAEAETTGLGAAFLAGLAAGVFESPAACAALAPPPDVFEPSRGDAWRARERERWRSVVRRARNSLGSSPSP